MVRMGLWRSPSQPVLSAQRLPQDGGRGPVPRSACLDSVCCRQRPPPAVLLTGLQRARTCKCRSCTAQTGVIPDWVLVCGVFLRLGIYLSASISAPPADPHPVLPAPHPSSGSRSSPLRPAAATLPPCQPPLTSVSSVVPVPKPLTQHPHIPTHPNLGSPASTALCSRTEPEKYGQVLSPPVPSLLSPAVPRVRSPSAPERPQPGHRRPMPRLGRGTAGRPGRSRVFHETPPYREKSHRSKHTQLGKAATVSRAPSRAGLGLLLHPARPPTLTQSSAARQPLQRDRMTAL